MISRHNDTTPSSHRQIIRSSDHQIMTSSHRGRLGRQGARPTLPGLELVEVHACRTTRHQSSRSPAVTRSNTLSAKHTDKNTNKKRRIFRGLGTTCGQELCCLLCLQLSLSEQRQPQQSMRNRRPSSCSVRCHPKPRQKQGRQTMDGLSGLGFRAMEG